MDRNGGNGDPLGVELSLKFLCPEDSREFREAITGHLWPHITFVFTVEIINGAELDSWGEESVSPRRKLKGQVRIIVHS